MYPLEPLHYIKTSIMHNHYFIYVLYKYVVYVLILSSLKDNRLFRLMCELIQIVNFPIFGIFPTSSHFSKYAD